MKKRNRFSAILLLAVLVLTSCRAAETTTPEPETTVPYTQPSSSVTEQTGSAETTVPVTKAKREIDGDLIPYDGAALTEEEQALYEKPFTVSAASWKNAVDKIGSIDVAYEYESYFNVPDHTDLSYTPGVKAGTIIQNKTVNASVLEQFVLKNNAAYIKEYEQYDDGATTPSFVSQMCRDIAKEINYFLAKTDVDLDLLEEKLQGLKVFVYSGWGSGVYVAAKELMQINKASTNDPKTISHEVVHLIQAASKREIDTNAYTKRLGYCYMTSEDKLNPYNFLWLIEGSAERLGTIDYLKQSKPNFYEKRCDALVNLKQACFDGGFDLELTTFQKDINVLYRFMAAQKQNAQNNIQKMLFAEEIMDVTSSDSEREVFFKSLGDQGFHHDYYKEQSVFSTYRCSMALTKAQIFYSKLAQKTADRPITLSELFSVISSFEYKTNISVYFLTDNDGVDDYLNEYCAIQQSFLEALAKSLGVSTKTMIALYSSYFYNSQQYSPVSWLSDAENRLFQVQYNNSHKKTARDVLYQN